MITQEPEWLEKLRLRWMQPNPSRFLRPDAHRFLRPDGDRFLRPDHARFDPLDALVRKYSPDQPRVLAGNPDGGQWTSGDEQANRIRVAELAGPKTDADGSPYYKPGGHHEMPKGVYEKWDLPTETRRVFDQATTGRLPPMLLRTNPDGVPQGHFWSGPGGAHGIYNEAITELSNDFFEQNKIKSEQMTPDQARSLLKEIRQSQDPRIRIYNNMIRLLRRLFPIRTGRGTE